MSSRRVVIARIGFYEATQVLLTQRDDMVDALTPDRADQPLHEAVLGLKNEAPRFKRKNISAAIAADVKRFCHQIKTDEVFGTHNRYGGVGYSCKYHRAEQLRTTREIRRAEDIVPAFEMFKGHAGADSLRRSRRGQDHSLWHARRAPRGRSLRL
jgi:hypothetical protein